MAWQELNIKNQIFCQNEIIFYKFLKFIIFVAAIFRQPRQYPQQQQVKRYVG